MFDLNPQFQQTVSPYALLLRNLRSILVRTIRENDLLSQVVFLLGKHEMPRSGQTISEVENTVYAPSVSATQRLYNRCVLSANMAPSCRLLLNERLAPVVIQYAIAAEFSSVFEAVLGVSGLSVTEAISRQGLVLSTRDKTTLGTASVLIEFDPVYVLRVVFRFMGTDPENAGILGITEATV